MPQTAKAPDALVLAPARTPEELEARYEQVLAILKSPAAPGALVLETGPDSPGRAAGIWPGDIITRYNDRPIEGDLELRQAVADAVAPQEGRVPLVDVRVGAQVRRGQETIALRVPKGPLGLTILTVDSGVPGPLNPPASPRAKLKLAWDKLTWATRGQRTQWMALELHDERFALERATLTQAPDQCVLNLVTSEYAGGESRCRIEFNASDNQTIPGFALDTLKFIGATGAAAERHGLMVRGTINRGKSDVVTVAAPTTLDAVPTYALALVAAVLPQEADLVMPVAPLSEIDLQTRVGYCLLTRGPKTLKRGRTETVAWCVQMLHFGRPEMTFWFNDARELLHADFGMGLSADAATPEQIAQFKVDHQQE